MIDANAITPTYAFVIVRLLGLDEIYDSLITQSQSTEEEIAVRYGEVLSLGPDVDKYGNCKGLKVGDIALFTEFAGYHIPTDNEMIKVIRAYDVIGKTMNIKDFEKLEPTENRVLVEIESVDSLASGIILNGAPDPRLADLTYGKVIKTGPATALELEEGDLVAFPPFAGTIVRHYESEKDKELKIVLEYDILFTVSK